MEDMGGMKEEEEETEEKEENREESSEEQRRDERSESERREHSAAVQAEVLGLLLWCPFLLVFFFISSLRVSARCTTTAMAFA